MTGCSCIAKSPLIDSLGQRIGSVRFPVDMCGNGTCRDRASANDGFLDRALTPALCFRANVRGYRACRDRAAANDGFPNRVAILVRRFPANVRGHCARRDGAAAHDSLPDAGRIELKRSSLCDFHQFLLKGKRSG
jgi:hypothetical protein